jgi:hypothetical protein
MGIQFAGKIQGTAAHQAGKEENKANHSHDSTYDSGQEKKAGHNQDYSQPDT